MSDASDFVYGELDRRLDRMRALQEALCDILAESDSRHVHGGVHGDDCAWERAKALVGPPRVETELYGALVPYQRGGEAGAIRDLLMRYGEALAQMARDERTLALETLRTEWYPPGDKTPGDPLGLRGGIHFQFAGRKRRRE